MNQGEDGKDRKSVMAIDKLTLEAISIGIILIFVLELFYLLTNLTLPFYVIVVDIFFSIVIMFIIAYYFIVQRNLIGDALEESESRFKDLTDSLPQTVFEIDDEANLTYANLHGLESSKYTQEDIDRGLNALQLFPPEERRAVKNNIRKIMSGKKLGGIERTLLRKDGTTYPVIVYSNPIMHKDKAVGLRGVVVDITERKRIENALRESDGNLRNILESSPDAIIVTNMKGRIVECNRSSLNVFGCSTKSELIGKNGLDMLAPNERQRGEEALKMTLEEGYSMTKEQICMTTDGHEFPAEVSAGALRDLSNRPIGFVTTIKDISQRTKAEEELLQSQKLASIGQLAAGVAHEINTPLTNISLMTENLMKRTNDPEIMGKLKGISEQQMFAANIVKDLLSFSRKTTPEIKNVNLNDAVAGSISLLKEQMPELIKIIKDFQPDMPDIKADPEQLQRVFTNIIDNAVDAMPKGGKLTIATAKKNNGCVEMRFMDTGTGIPREDIGRVFDPFFTKKSGQLGTGLGLSICHGIVRAHNGTIEVESEEGKGTTFIINLPVI